MFSKFVFACALCFSTALMAQSATDAKSAKIEEFLKVAKLDQVSGQMMQMIGEQVNSDMAQQLSGTQIGPAEKKRLDIFNAKAMKIIAGAMSWDQLRPAYVKIYSDAFTEQQMDDLLSFYKSSTGQAMVEKTPVLLQQGGQLGRERLESVMPQLQQLMKDFADEEAAALQSKP